MVVLINAIGKYSGLMSLSAKERKFIISLFPLAQLKQVTGKITIRNLTLNSKSWESVYRDCSVLRNITKTPSQNIKPGTDISIWEFCNRRQDCSPPLHPKAPSPNFSKDNSCEFLSSHFCNFILLILEIELPGQGVSL